jgi:NAD(P)-dependent dehydrogenase (short-subunit alcohol dehydrogenase family)
LGPIDILVNNAGSLVERLQILELTEAKWDEIMNLNLKSAMLCSQCVHVYLRKDGVSIETKLQKVEEVKKRRSFADRLRVVLNLVLPGAQPSSTGPPGGHLSAHARRRRGDGGRVGAVDHLAAARRGAGGSLAMPVLVLSGFAGPLQLRRKG